MKWSCADSRAVGLSKYLDCPQATNLLALRASSVRASCQVPVRSRPDPAFAEFFQLGASACIHPRLRLLYSTRRTVLRHRVLI